MDDNNNIIVVWSQYTDAGMTKSQVFKSECRDGVWTFPGSKDDSISPGETGVASPQVACNSRSSSVIVWQQSDGYVYQIFVSTRIVPIPKDDNSDGDSDDTPGGDSGENSVPFPGTLGGLMLVLGLLGAYGAAKRC